MAIFITGSNGFIGVRLLRHLLRCTSERVYCLIHSRVEAFGALRFPGVLDVIEGGLHDVAAYVDCLARCDTVVHLAAATGNVGPRRYHEVNVQGTALLLDACRRSGVKNIVFLSTIAVTFADQAKYHYAQSKQEAEQLVQASGLNFLIVRPTIVVGAGGKAWDGLRKLALPSCVVVLGDGKHFVQPIYVSDLAAILSSVILAKQYRNETLEVGGPERVSILELLRRIHVAYTGKEPLATLTVPLGILTAILTFVETVAGPIWPLSLGQLATFKNDGCADPGRMPASNGATTSIARMMALTMQEEREGQHGPTA